MNERQKLATQRAGLVKQAKNLHDLASHREWTPEESAKVDDIVAQIQQLDIRLVAAE